jgi:hypothetical protein
MQPYPCGSPPLPWNYVLRYLAFCIFSLKRIDRAQKREDVPSMEAYGELYDS